jgi:2-oxoglutarate ferredoxin oxidoreductase subunit beta
MADKSTRSDAVLYLEDGKPLTFGKNREKALRLKGFEPEVVNVADVPADSLLAHDERASVAHAFFLSRLSHPEFPEPVGVFRAVEQGMFDTAVREQLKDAVASRGEGDLQALLTGPAPWTVE